MTEYPPPLSPADADLRNFRFMPINVAQLRQSRQWLIAKRYPEIGFYSMNLWLASWHEVPAGSLEDDDDVLSDRAMCATDKWPKVKARVMRGWVKCSDGRLYHPVVAQEVAVAWKEKCAYRENTAKARAAREIKRKQRLGDLPQDSNRTADRTVDSSATGLTGTQTKERPVAESSTVADDAAGRASSEEIARVLDAAGNSPNLVGTGRISSWKRQGADITLIVSTIVQTRQRNRQRDANWEPTNLSYFDQPIARAIADAKRPLPAPTAPNGSYRGKPRPKLSPAEQIDYIRSWGLENKSWGLILERAAAEGLADRFGDD